MTVFGDHDPEDAYDAGDPLPIRAGLVLAIANSIAAEKIDTGLTARVAARIDALRRIVDHVLAELED
jgi:hypothetical protein